MLIEISWKKPADQDPHCVWYKFKLINMKYRIILTSNILAHGKVNFLLVLNEKGPGWTSRSWYFHTPGLNEYPHNMFSWRDKQGWNTLKISTCPTSPYVLVNSIINIGNSQNFYTSYSIRHSPWRADEWIFPVLKGINLNT